MESHAEIGERSSSSTASTPSPCAESILSSVALNACMSALQSESNLDEEPTVMPLLQPPPSLEATPEPVPVEPAVEKQVLPISTTIFWALFLE